MVGDSLVEVLHAHEPVGAVGGLRPPRPAVALLVAGGGRVHVGGHRAHLVLGEHPGDVEEAGLGEEVAHLARVVVGVEGAGEVERLAVGVGERRPRRWCAPAVRRSGPRRITHQSRKSSSRPAGMSRSPPVKKPIGVRRSCTRSARSSSSSRTSAGAAAGPGVTVTRPSSSASVQARPSTSTESGRGASSRRAGGDERCPLACQAGQLLVEEPAWIDRPDVGGGSGADID